MKAKNTSPKAYVCRFNGGQFAIDSDEGVNVENWGPERTHAYKATNLEYKAIAKARTSGFGAHSSKAAANRDIYQSTKKTPEIVPAHVGGGHPRKHQG